MLRRTRWLQSASCWTLGLALALTLSGCGGGETPSAAVSPPAVARQPAAVTSVSTSVATPVPTPTVAPTATSQPTPTPVPIATPQPPAAITRLQIPALNLDVAPLPVGLDAQGVPVVPRHDVGWYAASALPGQGSNIVFWGHVLRWRDTPQIAAPFERIHELPQGAEVLITTADGRRHRYQVTQQIEVQPVTTAYLLPTPFERVTLVSCIGDNVIVDGTLTKALRLVTLAEPVR